jgi:hypothetical protein
VESAQPPPPPLDDVDVPPPALVPDCVPVPLVPVPLVPVPLVLVPLVVLVPLDAEPEALPLEEVPASGGSVKVQYTPEHVAPCAMHLQLADVVHQPSWPAG